MFTELNLKKPGAFAIIPGAPMDATLETGVFGNYVANLVFTKPEVANRTAFIIGDHTITFYTNPDIIVVTQEGVDVQAIYSWERHEVTHTESGHNQVLEPGWQRVHEQTVVPMGGPAITGELTMAAGAATTLAKAVFTRYSDAQIFYYDGLQQTYVSIFSDMRALPEKVVNGGVLTSNNNKIYSTAIPKSKLLAGDATGGIVGVTMPTSPNTRSVAVGNASSLSFHPTLFAITAVCEEGTNVGDSKVTVTQKGRGSLFWIPAVTTIPAYQEFVPDTAVSLGSGTNVTFGEGITHITIYEADGAGRIYGYVNNVAVVRKPGE